MSAATGTNLSSLEKPTFMGVRPQAKTYPIARFSTQLSLAHLHTSSTLILYVNFFSFSNSSFYICAISHMPLLLRLSEV